MADWLNFRNPQRILAILSAAIFLSGSVAFAWPSHADNPRLGDVVGSIEGDAISVEGPMSVEVVHGQTRTVLRSGSDVRVKAGQARIDLTESGQIVICGPAHLSVLKSGGSLTVALDSGTIHVHVENQLTLTIYTPQIQARPISIANGAEDFLVGIDSADVMCIRASKGAVRIEQQLTGQSVVVPQSGDVSLTNGQIETLRNTAGRCACELQPVLRPATVATEVSALATPEDIKKKAQDPKPAAAQANPAVPTEKEEPIYQVFMPPLQYDASAKVQREYDPNLIVLVRRVRVRPTLIFQGRVEGDPVMAQVTTPGQQKGDAQSPRPADDSTWNRVRNFFRKLWSPSS